MISAAPAWHGASDFLKIKKLIPILFKVKYRYSLRMSFCLCVFIF